MNTAMDDSVRLMRDDWNRRAKEDAYYYVAFANPNQAEDGFQRSADEVIPEIEGELYRLAYLGEGVARRALEIGCGPGRLILPLSRHFDEIYGVDISDEMIRIAQERLRQIPNAHFLVNNGFDLAPLEDNYFSFVYSYVVFQHIPSKEIVLNYLFEIQRVLLPGASLDFKFEERRPLWRIRIIRPLGMAACYPLPRSSILRIAQAWNWSHCRVSKPNICG